MHRSLRSPEFAETGAGQLRVIRSRTCRAYSDRKGESGGNPGEFRAKQRIRPRPNAPDDQSSREFARAEFEWKAHLLQSVALLWFHSTLTPSRDYGYCRIGMSMKVYWLQGCPILDTNVGRATSRAHAPRIVRVLRQWSGMDSRSQVGQRIFSDIPDNLAKLGSRFRSMIVPRIC